LIKSDRMITPDLNGDGNPDFLGAGGPTGISGGYVAMRLGNGDGTAGDVTKLPTRYDSNFSEPAVADFDHNGFADVATSGVYGHPEVLFGIDGSTFETGKNGEFLSASDKPLSGDFNEDGWDDLALVSGHVLDIQLNKLAPPPADPPPPPPDDTPPPASKPVDFQVGSYAKRTTAKALGRGFDVSGSCSPACQVHGEIRLPKGVARKLGLDRLLVSSDAIWDGGATLSLKTGPAGRQALAHYEGRKFKVHIVLTASYTDESTGQPVTTDPVTVRSLVRAR
jgi:hypothetical protein